MAAKIKSDTSELKEILANFQKFTTRTMPALVRQHARLLAVELGNRTQPFSVGTGAGKKALKLGRDAVETGINKVFRSKATIQGIIDKTTNENIKNRLQAAFNSGSNKKIGEIFKAVGMVNEYELLSKSALASKHKAHRSTRSGRTWSPKKTMLIANAGLPSYTKEIQKRVGSSKASWADCARQIGGVKGDGARGIPAFGKSKNHKATGAIVDGTKRSNPFITMTSKTPWASRVLPSSEIRHAHHIVRDKMIKQANKSIREAAKKNFNPDPINE